MSATAGVSSAKRRVKAFPAPAATTAEPNENESEKLVGARTGPPSINRPLPNNARRKPGKRPECILSPLIR